MEKKVISEMFVYIADDEEGEGVCAAMIGNTWMPLVGADRARVLSFRPFVKLLREVPDANVRLVHFSNRADASAEDPSLRDEP